MTPESPDCAGCRACCMLTPSLILHPELGDDPALYETTADGTRLAPRAGGGGCRYLGPEGCTIHDRRPATCRMLDCRRMARSALEELAGRSRQERRKEIRRHPWAEVFQAGLKRLPAEVVE